MKTLAAKLYFFLSFVVACFSAALFSQLSLKRRSQSSRVDGLNGSYGVFHRSTIERATPHQLNAKSLRFAPFHKKKKNPSQTLPQLWHYVRGFFMRAEERFCARYICTRACLILYKAYVTDSWFFRREFIIAVNFDCFDKFTSSLSFSRGVVVFELLRHT